MSNKLFDGNGNIHIEKTSLSGFAIHGLFIAFIIGYVAWLYSFGMKIREQWESDSSIPSGEFVMALTILALFGMLMHMRFMKDSWGNSMMTWDRMIYHILIAISWLSFSGAMQLYSKPLSAGVSAMVTAVEEVETEVAKNWALLPEGVKQEVGKSYNFMGDKAYSPKYGFFNFALNGGTDLTGDPDGNPKKSQIAWCVKQAKSGPMAAIVAQQCGYIAPPKGYCKAHIESLKNANPVGYKSCQMVLNDQ